MDSRVVRRSGDVDVIPLGAATAVGAGMFAVLDAQGFAVTATAAPGASAVGLFAEAATNPGAAGLRRVSVAVGTFLIDNDVASPVAQQHVGSPCYMSGNSTVSASDGGGTRGIAGIVTGIDQAGVWVLMGHGAISAGGSGQSVVALTQATFDALTPAGNTLYVISDVTSGAVSLRALTQTEFNALTPSGSTLYLIIG